MILLGCVETNGRTARAESTLLAWEPDIGRPSPGTEFVLTNHPCAQLLRVPEWAGAFVPVRPGLDRDEVVQMRICDTWVTMTWSSLRAASRCSRGSDLRWKAVQP